VADKPINPIVKLTKDEASRIVSAWLGEERVVTRVTRLTGGCVHTVLEAEFGGDESPIVLKVSHNPHDPSIQAEHDVLRYFRRHTEFPVPEPYACDVSGEVVPYSWLIMERLEGGHLGDAGAKLSFEDETRIQLTMGDAVGRLHSHTSDGGFGHCLSDQREASWPRYFQQRIRAEQQGAWGTGLMDDRDRPACDRIIDAIPQRLSRDTLPTLVHGDIWATNIMVTGEPGEKRLSGFLDPGGLFADPEYELAYLQIWRTADDRFFTAYADHQPVAEGYDLRRLFYWLNTLLLHVRAFRTDYYAQAATDLIRRLSAAL
jgi:fructosamine-3-kinase